MLFTQNLSLSRWLHKQIKSQIDFETIYTLKKTWPRSHAAISTVWEKLRNSGVIFYQNNQCYLSLKNFVFRDTQGASNLNILILFVFLCSHSGRDPSRRSFFGSSPFWGERPHPSKIYHQLYRYPPRSRAGTTTILVQRQ